MARKNKGISHIWIFLLALTATLAVGALVLLVGWIFTSQGHSLVTVAVEGESLALLHSEEAAVEAAAQTDAETAEEMEETGKYTQLLADPEGMASENMIALRPAEEGEISITFAGDILFDGSYAIMARMQSRYGSDSSQYVEGSFGESLLEKMRGADIFMVNNEFTYTTRGEAIEDKTYTFRADPEHVSLLGDMGADIVSLANNHTYDYGEISLLDTLDTLAGAGIAYVGAGRDIDEAASPVYFVSENVKIAFLSATQIERLDDPDTKGATESSAGVFRCWDVELLLEQVEAVSEVSDFVVVYIHWGTESTDELDWAQLQQAQQIAEAGADLIIGDHPHVLQEIDWIGQTPVFYSMGNYLFNSRTMDTCLVTVRLDADTGELLSLQFVPAQQSDCRVDELTGSERERVLAYMREISDGVEIDDEGYVTQVSS